MFAQVVSVVRGWAVFKGRGWEARLVEPGAPPSEGRGRRGFRPSTGAVAFNAGFVPDDEGPPLAISPELALAAQALVHDKA